MARRCDDEVARNDLIKKRIHHNYDKFNGKFDPKGYVLDKLYATGILTLADKTRISELSTVEDRSDRLLVFLFKTCHPEAYIVFRETLLEDYKWLVEKFIDTDASTPNGGYQRIEEPLPLINPKHILEQMQLFDTELKKKAGVDITKTIEWTQVSRSIWGCKENYRDCEYVTLNGTTVQVFVAETNEVGPPPSSFKTNGYRGMLHVGILNEFTNYDAKTGPPPVFFVIHPRGWMPFQQRFYGAPQSGFWGAVVKSNVGDYLQYIG